MGNDVHPLLEHSNRGKKSLGLDLTSPDGLDDPAPAHRHVRRVPHQQAAARAEEAAHRASTTSARTTRTSSTCAAPARASAGPTPTRAPTTRSRSGPRAGVAIGATRPEYDLVPNPPAPGFGDSIGAMTIAGGIMGALFHRERTGEATVVDVSLLGTGLWAMGQAIALSLQMDIPWTAPPRRPDALQPARRDVRHQRRPAASRCAACRPAQYWPPLCEAIGRPELATDPRFADHAALLEHTAEAAGDPARGVRGAHRRRVARRARRLRRAVDGRAAHARGRRRPAGGRQRLHPGRHHRRRHAVPARPPRRCSSTRSRRTPRRAPEFNEHGDEILAELGLDWDAIIDLKVRGVVA